MSDIDKIKFKPQNAMAKAKATANGVCIKAMCVTLVIDGHQLSIAASNVETLKYAWDKIMNITMDEGGIQNIAMFNQKNIEEQS